MKIKKRIWYVVGTVVAILVGWLILTVYVEREGAAKEWTFGTPGSTHKALIIFDPDPFYNLDEKVCASFARALSENGFQIDMQTVAIAERSLPQQYDLFVYCANTYNWRPDWAIQGFVRSRRETHKGKPIVAITLGAGSTKSSQDSFEQIIANSNGTLISSYSLWLWRPNDETKPKEPNVEMAVSMAYEWGKSIARQF